MNKLLIFLFINVFFAANAQNVGINTDEPKEILHVKGKFRFEPIVTSTNPAAQAGSVLSSDSNGNATWKTVTFPTNLSVTATYGSSGATFTNTGNNTVSNSQPTGTSITLPKGTWIVTFAVDVNVTMGDGSVMPNSKSVWLRSSLYDSNTATAYTNSSADINDRPLISKEIIGPATHTMMIGEFKITNAGPNPKTYYYMISMENIGFSNSEVSKLWAFAVGPQTNPANRIYANVAKQPVE